MKKTINCAMLVSAAMILGLSFGCTPKTVTVPAAQVRGNPLVGDWEGKDKKGELYTFTFTSNGWESHVERNGIKVPFYRGTYTSSGTRVEMQVTAEVDRETMKWVSAKTVFPTMTGRLADSVLTIPRLTEAGLLKQ
jgi:hypothetical protein